jgi:Tfp pilus assembly protein PilX
MRPARTTHRKRRSSAEAGFALPSAMIILFIVVVLTAAAVSVATQSSTSTSRDTNVKAELEAAEAGLHVAGYRLSALKPRDTQCINQSHVTSSNCNDSGESLGNGASFSYWTTVALKAGEKCAGRSVEAISGTTQRCVTAEGVVNGVEPGVRLQARVAALGGEALFPVKGILGLHKVLVNGSVSVPGVVASNGLIRGEGSADFTRGFEICPPEGEFKPAAGEERKRSGVKVHGESPGPTPGYEITRSAAECPFKAPVPAGHPTAESNEDSRIGAADKLTGTHHTWNAEKFEFSMEGSEADTLTLGEAGRTTRYFFCSFKLSRGPVFKIAAGAKVEIYIGSPEETSKCAAGTGAFTIEGGAKTNNEAKNPAAFLVMIGGKGPFVYNNGSATVLEASIYAPNAEVKLNGGVEFKGGIVGYEVLLERGTKFYEWSEETGSLTNGNASAYSRKAWEQCASGSGPKEGC